MSANSNSGSEDSGRHNDDVDVDFHVEFPSPGNVAEDEMIWPVNDNVKSDGGVKEEKPVLVILLGWAGSQHKYLSKYSDIYLQRGCIVLRYICPVKYMFFETPKMSIVAERLVQLICDLQLTGHPTFVHSFSNGGTFLYSFILREIVRQNKTKEIDLRGTIIDSAPALRKFGPLFMALTNIFASLKMFRHVAAALFIVALWFRVMWFYIGLGLKFCMNGESMYRPLNSLPPKPERIPFQFWLTRIIAMKNHPFMFIYSDADTIIKDTGVERIADVIKERGNYVKMLKFQGSEHVQHYRQYPREYVNGVKSFIRTTMNANNGTTVFWDEFE